MPSVWPPAGYGTTIRIGLLGKAPWARDAVKTAGVARTPALAAMRRRRVVLKIGSSLSAGPFRPSTVAREA